MGTGDILRAFALFLVVRDAATHGLTAKKMDVVDARKGGGIEIIYPSARPIPFNPSFIIF